MALFRLIDDMMRDRSVRRRFNLDPKEVMLDYNLSLREKRHLLTMDPVVISDIMPAEMKPEVGAYQLPIGEFPPVSEDFFAEGGGLDPQYPSPAPGVFRWRTNPLTISAAAINATASVSFELVVFGQSLLECELKLVRTTDQKAANIAEFHVIGTFRCSILRAVFSPPEATWVAGHKYQVTVINQPGTPAKFTKLIEPKPLLEVKP